MSNAPDIERMFAYIGVKEGQYREFASGDDPSDALSTWALVDSSDAEAAGREPGHVDATQAAPVQNPDAFAERLASRRAAASPPAMRPAMPPPGRIAPTMRPPTAGGMPPVGMPPFRPSAIPGGGMSGGRPPSLAQRPPLDPNRRPAATPVARPPSLAPQPRPVAPAPAAASHETEEMRTAFLTPQPTLRVPQQPAAPAPARPDPYADPYRTVVTPAAPMPERTLFSRPIEPPPPQPSPQQHAPQQPVYAAPSQVHQPAAYQQPARPQPAPEPAAQTQVAPIQAAPASGGLNRVFAKLGGTPKEDGQPAAGATPLSRIFRRLS